MCDAKFYTSDLSEKTISKTVDDMKLRGTNLGLLVCSQDTKLHTYDQMYKESRVLNLKALKLRPSQNPEKSDLNPDEYLLDYITVKNQILIESKIEDLVEEFRERQLALRQAEALGGLLVLPTGGHGRRGRT